MVFHSKGVSAYDPLRCLLRHQVSGDFSNFMFIPDAIDGPLTLCRKGEDCQWGDAVKVGSEFIYVSQPDQRRLVVMNAGSSWNPVQVEGTVVNIILIIYRQERKQEIIYTQNCKKIWYVTYMKM